MKQIPAPEIFSQLTQWALRPDAFTDLRNIFGGDSDRYQLLLQSIRSGDFSWVPQVQILPADSLGSADGAYSRETGTIYLSSDCPADLKESVLLEEIGHHIDALFNEQETPGDEGSLFSAAVRGITLSDEEITAILNEDDSAVLSLNGHQVAVECAAKPAPPSRAPLHPIVTVGPGTKSGTGTVNGDSISSAVSYDLSTSSPAAHGLTLTGSGNLIGYGNSQIYNYLDARQNSGNTTLFAGPSAPTAKGPSSSTLWGGAGDDVLVGWTGARAAVPAGTKLPAGFAANTDLFVGGAGSSTIYAGNVASTLIGGQKNNLLVADVLSGANQSLWGGNNNGSSLYGNTLYGGTGKDTLRSGSAYNTLISGSTTALQSNTLIGGGISNSLVAGSGNDSLTAVSGNSTLVGDKGKDTLLSGTGTNSLVSGSAVGLPGNGNLLNASLGTSNTLVAGLGRDTLIGGTQQNLLLVNQANLAAFGTDSISLSTLSSASNTLGVTSPTPITITDALLATMATAKVTNLGTVANLPIQGNASQKIILGTNAEKVGVHTLVAGLGGDTLSVAGYATNSALLDASKSVSRTSLLGGGTGNDTFLGSKGGYDTMIGASGNDSFVIQASALAGSSFGLVDGKGGTSNTLSLGAAAILSGANFNSVQNIQLLQLGAGNNSIGSLQGSGIQKIVGNTGSDTLSANVYGAVKSVTLANSSSVTLNVTPGTSATMGFEVGQAVTGNGIAVGTTITGVSSTPAVGATPGTVTITLSNKTISLISQGGAVTGWLNRATLDGSAALGLPPTDTEKTRAGKALANMASSITAANYGQPFELSKDTLAISTLKNDPSTYVHRKGDYLVSYGQNNLLIGGQGKGLPDINVGGNNYPDQSSVGVAGSLFLGGYPYTQHQVVDNTLVSGAFASNTLIGGSGANLYLINNQPGATTALPTIQNPTTLQSASTIQFTGNGVKLDDTALSSVSANAAQKIITANGNNLIAIGINAAKIGIQTIIGGVGADTFVTGLQLGAPVTFTLTADALSGSTTIFVNDTTNLSTGSLVTGSGIPDKTTIQGIDIVTSAITLSLGITRNLSTNTELTETPLTQYTPSVYFDASKGVGNESLASGVGNDTLLAGNGNATIVGGDGNNSLIGGSGNNLILSGVGNSTLDGGLGVSTLQADGGINTFVVRNRNTRILNPFSLERDPVTGQIIAPNPAPVATTPEIGIVNSYVNFDPIQSTQVNQFAPTLPDGSPSITKSISFASADLSSFYNLQYFNLLGSASYGVGNALDNTMTSASANALMLGMGGNNTLVGNGDHTSLYGYVNSAYANPDLYAAAPFDTRDQSFIDGVIGFAGNNSLVANGANSYLDGGPGYKDGLGGSSGSNTLIGTKGGDTFVVRNQADVVVAAAGGNNLLSTVDLHSIANNITRATLLVTTQAPNLPNIDPNNPTLPANSGQTDPATFLGFGNGVPNSTVSEGFVDRNLKITVQNATLLDVQYGTAAGEQYSSTSSDPDHQITVTSVPGIPTSRKLTWTAYFPPVPTNLGVVVGYSVYYRTDDGNGNLGPWKTYVNGSSLDMAGTYTNPSLTVDNLPTLPSGQSYDFQVTAQQLTLPTTTDPNTGIVTPTPVTLQGSNGNDVIWASMPSESLFGGALVGYDSNAPILTNNPYGTIPVPTQPAQYNWDSYPVYMDGQNGNDLFVTQQIGNGDGSSYSPFWSGLTYSGLNTMVGGVGSDTFIVSNGTQNNFDLCIKYGNETPVDYTNVAPSTPTGIGATGVSLNGGQHNLIISNIAAIELSSTVVSQGKYIDELCVNGDGKFGEGNNLNNFIYDVNAKTGGNILVGNIGRDSIVGTGAKDLLIGGTATGTDSIAGALLDYAHNGTNSVSIYRDTDPTPSNAVTGGPGLADPSQYWTQNARLGGLVYNSLANSDTLIATASAAFDGGAGADSMVGSSGNDTIYISSGGTLSLNGGGYTNIDALTGVSTYTDKYSPTQVGNPLSDVVSGGGGNDTIIYTGSDIYWSGLQNATTAQLGYALSNTGDSTVGQSISNITLQMGDPIARSATGNSTSTGNVTLAGGSNEVGSNILIGNEYGATLNGGGVGGTDSLGGFGNGTGIGIDSLVGNAKGAVLTPPAGTTIQPVTGTADTFVIGTALTPMYTGSTSDAIAAITTSVPDPYHTATAITSVTGYATDKDYAYIDAKKSTVDSLLGGNGAMIYLSTKTTYLIGSAPTGLKENNISGGLSGVAETAASVNKFGIYALTSDKAGNPFANLVAVIDGIKLEGDLMAYTSNGLTANGQNGNGVGGTDKVMGGSTGLYNNGAELLTAENFAGMGAFYNLTGSKFNTNHVHLG